MPDREKVIRHIVAEISIARTCKKDFASVDIDMLSDALVLLKEQEAVKPILVREGWNKHHNNYVCPRCDNEVVYEQNYCSDCGVRFLWEGR
jgi:DNA-directed RNA polymerase subunit RPC12/RpoP